MKLSDLEILSFVSPEFQENAYLIRQNDAAECVIIDPGLSPKALIQYLKANAITPVALLITHGHYDHIAGIDAMKKEWSDLEILVGEKDREKLTNPKGNLSADFGFPMTTFDATRSLQDQELVTYAGISFLTLDLPGHSQGHVIYQLDAEDGTVVFVGDVIFKSSIGRTDFFDGNHQDLIRGIHERLLTLPAETVLYPGHGPQTTVQFETMSNPWI